MKKIIAIFASALILIALIYNVGLEIRAIKNAKVEIYDAKLGKINLIHRYVTLNLSIKIINDEKKRIEDLQGKFNIYILNVSIGEMNFSKIDIPSYSSRDVSMRIKIYFDKVAESIVEAIKKLNFKITLKGYIKGKIFFSLIDYKQNVEASYQYI